MKNTFLKTHKFVFTAFLVSLLLVSGALAHGEEGGVVAGAGPVFEETPTPTPAFTPAPTDTPAPTPTPALTATPSPTPVPVSGGGFMDWLMGNLLWVGLGVLAAIIAGIYLMRRGRGQTSAPLQ